VVAEVLWWRGAEQAQSEIWEAGSGGQILGPQAVLDFARDDARRGDPGLRQQLFDKRSGARNRRVGTSLVVTHGGRDGCGAGGVAAEAEHPKAGHLTHAVEDFGLLLASRVEQGTRVGVDTRDNVFANVNARNRRRFDHRARLA
jgi:hypothetical protein